MTSVESSWPLPDGDGGGAAADEVVLDFKWAPPPLEEGGEQRRRTTVVTISSVMGARQRVKIIIFFRWPAVDLVNVAVGHMASVSVSIFF